MGSAPPPHPHPFRTLLKCPSKNLDIIESDLITKAKIWKVYDWSLDARTIANEKRVYIISMLQYELRFFFTVQALKLREETDKEEEKEKELVYECIEELGENFFLHFLSALYELYIIAVYRHNLFRPIHLYSLFLTTAEAKEQISHLTDEISLKAEDNIEQQVSTFGK